MTTALRLMGATCFGLLPPIGESRRAGWCCASPAIATRRSIDRRMRCCTALAADEFLAGFRPRLACRRWLSCRARCRTGCGAERERSLARPSMTCRWACARMRSRLRRRDERIRRRPRGVRRRPRPAPLRRLRSPGSGGRRILERVERRALSSRSSGVRRSASPTRPLLRLARWRCGRRAIVMAQQDQLLLFVSRPAGRAAPRDRRGLGFLPCG